MLKYIFVLSLFTSKFFPPIDYKDDDKIIKLKATIEQLPPNNLRVLHYLIGFLHKYVPNHNFRCIQSNFRTRGI